MSGIRLGDIPDMNAIVELAYELHRQSDYAEDKPDEQKFRLLVANMMGDKSCRVIVVVDADNKPQGFFLGLIEDLFFSRSRYATDLAFYVREQYRHAAPRMAQKFIMWAKSKPRVGRIILGISSGMGDPERVGRMYEKLGLPLVGGIHMMRI